MSMVDFLTKQTLQTNNSLLPIDPEKLQTTIKQNQSALVAIKDFFIATNKKFRGATNILPTKLADLIDKPSHEFAIQTAQQNLGKVYLEIKQLAEIEATLQPYKKTRSLKNTLADTLNLITMAKRQAIKYGTNCLTILQNKYKQITNANSQIERELTSAASQNNPAKIATLADQLKNCMQQLDETAVEITVIYSAIYPLVETQTSLRTRYGALDLAVEKQQQEIQYLLNMLVQCNTVDAAQKIAFFQHKNSGNQSFFHPESANTERTNSIEDGTFSSEIMDFIQGEKR